VRVLAPEKARIIGPNLTARSYQFSADIVSVPGNGRAFRRCRIVVDASGDQPKIVYRQNLTRLGWPLDEGILVALRSGQAMDEAVAKVNTLTMSNR
jgi:hypothetical protein